MKDKEKEEKLTKAQEILLKVKEALLAMKEKDDDIELQPFLEKLGIEYDDYKDALKISEKGNTVVLKRKISERFVNNYNPKFMLAWQANLDLQIALDCFAVITYITDYISKSDAGLTRELKKALKESPKDSSNFQRLTDLKKAYFTHVQVSQCNAVYTLVPGMNLKSSNLGTIYVATGFPENRSGLWKRVVEKEDEVEGGDENIHAPDDADGVQIDGRTGTFKKVETIHDKYSVRPEPLADICLAQFATSYELCETPKKTTFVDGCSEELGYLKKFCNNQELPRHIMIKKQCMRLRCSPSVLRMNISTRKGGHEEAYSQLLLFFPWRDDEEEELCRNDEKQCLELLQDNLDIVNDHRRQIFPFAKEVDAMRFILNSDIDSRPAHVFDSIDPINQQENIEDESEAPPIDETELPQEKDEDAQKKKATKSRTEYGSMRQIQLEETDVLLQMKRSLGFEQNLIFEKLVKYLKQDQSARCKNKELPEPPRIIGHGEKFHNHLASI